MANTKHVLILSMVLILFIGCTDSYTYDDNVSTIELSEDDPFEILLQGSVVLLIDCAHPDDVA